MSYFVKYRCTYHGGSFGRGQTKALTCSQPKIGRYVFVKLRVNEYLTLCEVEVMAIKSMYQLIVLFYGTGVSRPSDEYEATVSFLQRNRTIN